MQPNNPSVIECGECDSTTVFVLDNGKERFAVHLEVLLQCLKLATEHGQIPPLPDEWWWQMSHNLDSRIFQ